MAGRTVSPHRYHRVTLLALFALSFIIMTGAAVRLTGSGLGCSDWPNCEEDQFIAEVDNLHAMVEFVNRLITGLVSVAVALAVLGSMRRVPYRRDLVLALVGLVAGVLAQIVIGMFVVETDLVPGVVMLHFLVSMVLVWNALVLHHRAALSETSPPARQLPQTLNQARLLSVLVSAVLIAGTVATGAGPHAGDEEAERLDVSIFRAVQVHSVLVWMLVAATGWMAWTLVRTGGRPTSNGVKTLLILLVAQGGVGYLQYFTDVPALLVGLHVLGATSVWIAVIALHLRVRQPVPTLLDRPPTEPVSPGTPRPTDETLTRS